MTRRCAWAAAPDGAAVPVGGQSALAGYDGRQVAVGIRPEHLKAGTEGAPDTICGVIDVREGLGSEVILHMVTDAVGVDIEPRTAGRRPTASSWQVEPHITTQVGERAALPVGTGCMHLVRPRHRPVAQLTAGVDAHGSRLRTTRPNPARRCREACVALMPRARTVDESVWNSARCPTC